MNLGKIDCKSISYKIKSSEKSEDFFVYTKITWCS